MLLAGVLLSTPAWGDWHQHCDARAQASAPPFDWHAYQQHYSDCMGQRTATEWRQDSHDAHDEAQLLLLDDSFDQLMDDMAQEDLLERMECEDWGR
jgi:hypothetical protein